MGLSGSSLQDPPIPDSQEQFHRNFAIYPHSFLPPGCRRQNRNWPSLFWFEIVPYLPCLMVSFSASCRCVGVCVCVWTQRRGEAWKWMYFFPIDSKVIPTNRHTGDSDPQCTTPSTLPKREKYVAPKGAWCSYEQCDKEEMKSISAEIGHINLTCFYIIPVP